MTPGSPRNAPPYSLIWPTQRVGTSAQPCVSHYIADHEWKC